MRPRWTGVEGISGKMLWEILCTWLISCPVLSGLGLPLSRGVSTRQAEKVPHRFFSDVFLRGEKRKLCELKTTVGTWGKEKDSSYHLGFSCVHPSIGERIGGSNPGDDASQSKVALSGGSTLYVHNAFSTVRILTVLDFPGGSDGKACVYNAGDLGSIPGSGRSAGEGNGNPLQCYCLENPVDRGAW